MHLKIQLGSELGASRCLQILFMNLNNIFNSSAPKLFKLLSDRTVSSVRMHELCRGKRNNIKLILLVIVERYKNR